MNDKLKGVLITTGVVAALGAGGAAIAGAAGGGDDEEADKPITGSSLSTRPAIGRAGAHRRRQGDRDRGRATRKAPTRWR